MAHQATDTFVAILDDGSDRLVTKGDVLSDNHELVRRDKKGGGTLFRPLDLGDDDDERLAKSAAEAEAEPKAAPVKARAAKAT